MKPRLRACGEGVMVVLSMVSEMSPVLRRVDLVPMRNSVLSALSFRKLCDSQVLIEERQVSVWVRGGFWEEDVVLVQR